VFEGVGNVITVAIGKVFSETGYFLAVDILTAGAGR
jgi:hypothetical protein